MAERGWAFRVEEEVLGSPHNGNFLGFIEVLAKYDPVLEEHLERVRNSQGANQKRMQAHYLSNRSQNNFIKCCGDRVREMILKEREKAIVMVDNSHKEQTTFILRYVYWDEDESSWIIYERFLCYVSCSDKSGEDIAKLILKTLEEYGIPISDCRGQGYDNGSKMAGKYKGAEAWILKKNFLAFLVLVQRAVLICATYMLPEVVTK